MTGMYYKSRKGWYTAIRKCLCKCLEIELDEEFAEKFRMFIKGTLTSNKIYTVKDLIGYGGEWLAAGVIKMAQDQNIVNEVIAVPRMTTIYVTGNSLEGVNQQICSDMGVYLYEEQEKKEPLVWTLVDNLKCWRDEETGMICGSVQMPCFYLKEIGQE